jgi:hypothetical protein
MPRVATQSKDFFALGSKYFDTGMAGSVRLLGGMRPFSQPRVVGGFHLSMHLPEISFTVWAYAEQTFVKGYILQKRLRYAYACQKRPTLKS